MDSSHVCAGLAELSGAPCLPRAPVKTSSQPITPIAASSPRTPTDREQQRRAHYKSGARSRSSEWKEKYRKRCLDRLKQSRERLVSQFRQMDADSDAAVNTDPPQGGSANCAGSVHEVMEQEWEKMRTEDATLPQITPQRKRGPSRIRHESCKRQPLDNPVFSSDEEYEESEDLEYILTIIDELTKELILEEQAMLRQCRERQVELDLRQYEDEEDSLIAVAMESMTVAASNVICPICQKAYLHQSATSIYCSCGIQIGSIHDGLSVEYLGQQLEACMVEHSTLCSGKPVFSLESNMGIQNLIMNCSLGTCDFMYIIL